MLFAGGSWERHRIKLKIKSYCQLLYRNIILLRNFLDLFIFAESSTSQWRIRFDQDVFFLTILDRFFRHITNMDSNLIDCRFKAAVVVEAQVE